MSSDVASGGGTTVIESVEFRATAPATRLPGLDNAQRKLEALSSAIKQVQSQLAGISTNAMFKLSPQQYAAKGYDAQGKALTGVGQMARRIGFGPDAVKDVRRVANQLVSEVHAAIAKIEREIERNPGFKKKALESRQQQIQALKNFLPFTNASASSFKNPGIAGQFFGGGMEEKIPALPKGFSFSASLREILKKGYAGVALANRERGEAAMRAILQGTVHDNGPAVYSPSTMAAAVTQAINQAKAESRTSASPKAESRNQKPEARGQKSEDRSRRSEVGKKGQGGGEGGTEERVLVPEEGPEVERRVEETPSAPDTITTTRRLGAYATQAAVEREGKVLKLTTREMTEKQVAATLDENLTTLKKEFARELPHARENGGTFAGLREKYAGKANAMFAGYEQHSALRDRFINETMPDAEQKEMARMGEQRKKLLKQRYLAEQKDDKLRRANIQAELDSLEQHRKALGKFNQSGQRAAKDIAREQKKTAAFTQKQQTQSLFNTVTTQGAMDAEADLQRRGAKLTKENFDMLTGRRTGATYHMTENGWLNKYRVEYNKEGDAIARKVSSLPAVKKNHDRLDQALEGLTLRNQAANLVKVTAWSAAVMVLYKSAELAGYSMRRLEQTGLEMAHLDVVFRGVGGTVQELTTDMLKLAAVEGRATSETMESAQSWARLGGDRKTINEEVRVSAEAANIANMHMAETSKQLQSLMHIYHLEASDLDSTLGGLVATSLRYNVTLEEMFTGLDRSAAAARVAGISLAELQGMLAVVTGTTGATGSTTGNALKYVFQELNKSEVQQTLRDKYKVETLDDKLNQKPVGQTLGELAGIWGTLSDRSKQGLSGTLGGRFNAARVPVVIEEYPQILKQAIDSQLGLNSAQTANAKIINTIRANMAGLRAEYDRLIMSGNVLAKVNLGAAVAKNVMHDTANWFSGPSPTDAEQERQRDQMRSNIQKHWFWSQAAGVARTIARAVTSLGILSHYGIGVTGPGMMDYNAFLHDEDDVVEHNREDRMEKLRQQERAGALQGQSFGIAKTMLENGTMTDVNANVFADTMRGMGPAGAANAAAFLKARGAGDKQGALAAVNQASSQAYDEQHKALDRKQVLLKVANDQLLKEREQNEAAIAARGNAGATAEQYRRRDELSRQLLKNRDDVNSLDGAFQELEGTIDTVQISQQKYLNLLKAQEGLMSGIEEKFTMVEAHTPAQKLAQQTAMLAAQQAAAKQAIDDFDATGDKTTEGLASRAQMVSRWKSVQAELAAAQARKPQADLLTAEQRGVVGAENFGRAANYGYDETAKLLRVREELTKDAARVEAELGRTVEGTVEHEELAGRLAKDNALVYEHTLDLARRRADVEAEIHQLAIDQNREFSRSFFGSGAADMLRKLAAFKLALAGGITQGQLYSMGPAMRQDVGELTGMNPDMTRLLRERSRLMANGFADGGYTGDGPADEIAGVVHRGEFVIPRGGFKGEEGPDLDDYAMRKTGQRGALPHGSHLATWRAYYQDQFEKDNARKADATLPGNLLAAEDIPGYVSQRQRDMMRTPMVAKVAAFPAGLAALYGAARLGLGRGGRSAAGAAGAMMDQHVQAYEGMLKRLDPTYAMMRRLGLNNRLGSLWPTAQGAIPSSEMRRLDPVHGVLRWAMGMGNSVAKRKPVSAAVQAARARYQQQMLAMNDPMTANPFFNSTKVTPENFNTMFDQFHSSQFGGPTGVSVPRGIPLDDMDALHAPPAGGLHMAPPSQTYGEEIRELLAQTHGQGGSWPSPSFGATTRNAATRGMNALGHGWTAARGFLSNPKNWVNMGKGLGMAGIGVGVTGSLNWAGGKVGIGGSDTYGGAAYGVFTDAVGGAVAGSRGGPLGAGIGAVSGMVMGDVWRLGSGIHSIGSAMVGDDKTHQQVSAVQEAILRRQRAAAEAPGPAPVHRVAAIQHDDAALDRRAAAAMAAADAQMARWHDLKRPAAKPIMGSNGKPAAINPATGLPWSSGTDHSIEGHPHVAAAHAAAGRPAPNNSAVMPVARPAAGGGSAPVANGGDDTAIKNASAALDLLATTAGKLNTAFAALATRADALFKAQPGLGNNGLQFAPTGQMGGSYPGKTH